MSPRETPFVQQGEPPVSGFLHEPATPSGDVVLLTHGAGGNCRAPLLVALARQLSADGFVALRFDLPFRQVRPYGPPSPASARRDQEGIRRAVAAMRARYAGRLFAGGQSYGGRQMTVVAAEDESLVAALLLLSYPLHPPGQPARLRTDHFPKLRIPSLFVSGTADPFASEHELATAIALVPARTQLVPVADAGHSLLTKKNANWLPPLIVERFRAFVA
jgi:predicted alpha/beta-hydrolase family hydrolase